MLKMPLILPFFYLALIPITLVFCSSSTDTSGDNQQMLDSVNNTRKSVGAKPVCLSDSITQASLPQTQYQASHDTLTHDGTQDVGTRITSTGFSQSGAGECVGMVNPDSQTAVYQAWVSDPAHYAILVNPDWTHMGWTKQKAASGAVYYTLDFAKAAGNEPCSSGSAAQPSTPPPSTPPQQQQQPASPSQPSGTGTAPPASSPYSSQFQPNASRQARRQQYNPYSQYPPSNQPTQSTSNPNMYGGDPDPSTAQPSMPDEDAQQMAMLSQYEAQMQQLQAQVAALKAQKAGNVF